MLTSAHRVICDILSPPIEIILGNHLSHHRSGLADISFESWKSALFESINKRVNFTTFEWSLSTARRNKSEISLHLSGISLVSYLEIGRAGVRLTRALYQTKGGSLLYRNQLTACLCEVPVSSDKLFKSATHFAILLNISLRLEKRDISGPRNEIKFGKRPSRPRSDSALIPDERGGSPLLELFNGSLVGGSPVKRYVFGVGHISVKPLHLAKFAPSAGLESKSSSGNGRASVRSTRLLYRTKGEGLLCSNYLTAHSWEVPR